MDKRLRFGASTLSIIAALSMLIATPVAAHHTGGHGGGNPHSEEGTDERRDCDQNKETREDYYDANCVPEESENGNGNSNDSGSESADGDGKSGGKPCAGCVGKADNKNPPGQEPDEQGEDSNKGYECDDNSGISARRGSGNPAHTGCPSDENVDEKPSPEPSPTEPCDEDPDMPGIQECDDGEVCDKDPNMPGIQECGGGGGVCDKDPNMPGTQKCDETEGIRVCDADPTMAGVQKCDDPLCPEDEVSAGMVPEDCVPPCPEDETMGDVDAEECLPPCPEDETMGDVAAEECVEVMPRDYCDKDPTMEGVQQCGEDEVLGATFPAAQSGLQGSGAGQVGEPAARTQPQVEEPEEGPGVLPTTGTSIDQWIMLALLLIAVGFSLIRPGFAVSRRRRLGTHHD